LAATVTGGALAASAAGAGGWLATVMGMSKLQAVIAGGVVVAGTVGFISQAATNADLRQEIAAQREAEKSVVALREENRQLASVAAEVEALRRDDAEYQRLAQRVAEAQKANAEAARLVRQREVARDFQASEELKGKVDQLNREGNALVRVYMMLLDRLTDAAHTVEEKAQLEMAAKQKKTEIQMKQREIQTLIANAKASLPPDFQSKMAESRCDATSQSVPGSITSISRKPDGSVDGSPAGQNELAYGMLDDNGRVTVSILPQETNLAATLSAYERFSGSKIVRDPSLAEVHGTLSLQAASVSREDAARILQNALHVINVVLEPGTDGTLVAKLGPPR
jgi:hypothetical protein